MSRHKRDYGSNNARIILLTKIGAVVLSVALTFSACDNHDSSRQTTATNTDQKRVLGTITAPDGVTPIASALVSTGEIAAQSHCSGEGSRVGNGCSNSRGEFEIFVDQNTDTLAVSVSKGVFHHNLEVRVDSNSSTTDVGVLALPVTPVDSGANLAVVTGQFDRIQDILAKLGFGLLDPVSFQLQLGSEGFQLYDGNDSLDDSLYPNADALFLDSDANNQEDIFDYDIVFINCNSSDLYFHWLNDAAVIDILRRFVNAGGNLYVSDLAYNIVEALFPGQLDFYGSDTVVETEVEFMDAAMTGLPALNVTSIISDPTLAAWLSNVNCFGGSCISANGAVSINGFKPAWAVLNGAHILTSNSVTVWSDADVQWGDYTGQQFSGIKPLTVMFDIGLGTVLFSSYHVHDNGQEQQLLPQERILQYLVFEM